MTHVFMGLAVAVATGLAVGLAVGLAGLVATRLALATRPARLQAR
jgi:membrane-bound metal-dependent hydrolase YbcI (DUF457 family)